MPPIQVPVSILRTFRRNSAPVFRSLSCPPLRQPLYPLPKTFPRKNHTTTTPKTPLTTSPPISNQPSSSPSPSKPPQPSYKITFTCDPCSIRSSHTISKKGYHHGSILITCPSCKNRHVISDHLNIFGDRSITVEDLMKERGKGLVKKGTLGEDGDVEWWNEEDVGRRDKLGDEIVGREGEGMQERCDGGGVAEGDGIAEGEKRRRVRLDVARKRSRASSRPKEEIGAGDG